MSYFINVGVMGPKSSGRTQLILTLKKNLPSIDIQFYELEMPKSDDHMSQLLKNLTFLLLLIPESFQPARVNILQEAKKLKIRTAIVITKFDATLMNLDPFTQQFTDEQKLRQIENDNNTIMRILKSYNCDCKIPIFHVSCLCFAVNLKPGFRACCADEKKLCDFLSHTISLSTAVNVHNVGNCIVPATYNFSNTDVTSNGGLSIFEKIFQSLFGFGERSQGSFNGPPTQLVKYEPCIEAVEHEYLYTYDVVIFATKNNCNTALIEILSNIFDEIKCKSIENSEFIDIKRELSNIECHLAVIIIQDNIDASTHEALNHFKIHNISIAVVIDSENGNIGKHLRVSKMSINCDVFMSLGLFKKIAYMLPPNMIFPFKIDAFNLENNEAKNFYKIVQEKTGKNLKQTSSKKRGITNSSCSKILILGLSEACLNPVFDILKHEGHVKKVEYSSNPQLEEIISEVKSADIAVIAIPVIQLDIYFNLFEELKNQSLEFILIFDVSDDKQPLNCTIEPTNTSIQHLSHVQCFNLKPSNENHSYHFIGAIKNLLSTDREKSRKYESSTHL